MEEKLWLVKAGEEWLPATGPEVHASILAAANQQTMVAGKFYRELERLIAAGRLRRNPNP